MYPFVKTLQVTMKNLKNLCRVRDKEEDEWMRMQDKKKKKLDKAHEKFFK